MSRTPQQSTAIEQTLRLLGGAGFPQCPTYRDRSERVFAAMRMANHLGAWHDDLTDIHQAALRLAADEWIYNWRAK